MSVCLPERRIPDSGVSVSHIESLVGGAVSGAAQDTLPVRRRQLRVEVDSKVDVREIPRAALAAPLAIIAIAVFGDDGIVLEAGVGTHKTYTML